MAPLAHNLPGRIQACTDRVISETGGSEEHDLGANDITIR
jgi:hypothetical protein